MSAAAPEYLFVTSAVLVNLENQGVTARAASARLGSIVPTRALTSLGYDARTCSVAGGLEAAAALVRSAKRVVFGELFATAEGLGPGKYEQAHYLDRLREFFQAPEETPAVNLDEAEEQG